MVVPSVVGAPGSSATSVRLFTDGSGEHQGGWAFAFFLLSSTSGCFLEGNGPLGPMPAVNNRHVNLHGKNGRAELFGPIFAFARILDSFLSRDSVCLFLEHQVWLGIFFEASCTFLTVSSS